MQERRQQDNKNWEEINKFIIESRAYREGDNVRQENLLKSVEDLNTKVKIQNGRIGKLETVVFGGEDNVGISHQIGTLVNVSNKIFWLATSSIFLAALPAVADFIAKVLHK
jgi:hypothetical protein